MLYNGAMTDILDRLLGHNAWTTQQLIEHTRALTAEQYVQRFDIGLGSVHDTLLHIIDVMFGWADRIAEVPRRPSLESEHAQPTRSADELINLLSAASAELEKTAKMIVDENRLDDMMSVTHEGRKWEFTRGTALTHAITHGMHHRAQIFNMMRKLGVPLDIDGDVIEWECTLRDGK